MKRKMCYILFILLVLLNVYDTYSTYTLFNSGMPVEYEFNPVVRFLISMFGQFVGIITLKVIALLLFLYFLLRNNTERLWNILTAGLILSVSCYTTTMYFINYPAMLLLSGG